MTSDPKRHLHLVGGSPDNGRAGTLIVSERRPDVFPSEILAELYGELAPEKAEALRKQAARIRDRIRTTTAAIIAIGDDLRAVKDDLEHGQFCRWVEHACGFGLRSAQNYMAAAKFAEGKSATVAHFAPATVYKLAAKNAPAEVVNEVISRAEVGEIMPDSRVTEMIADARAEARRAKAEAKLSPAQRKRRASIAASRKQQAGERERKEEDRRRKQQRVFKFIVDRLGEAGVEELLLLVEDAEESNGWLLLTPSQLVEVTAIDPNKGAAWRQPARARLDGTDDFLDIPDCLRRSHTSPKPIETRNDPSAVISTTVGHEVPR
jgi:hypothetical protein